MLSKELCLEAVEALKSIKTDDPMQEMEIYTALFTINELIYKHFDEPIETRWKPYSPEKDSEDKPKENGFYLVTDKDGRIHQDMYFANMDRWCSVKGEDVVAYMLLPRAYNKESEEIVDGD